MTGRALIAAAATAVACALGGGVAEAASCGGLLPGILKPPCPAAAPAPDPGGSESPDQPVPAAGKQFGFNSSLALTRMATPEQELDAARAAGATVHRMPVPWRSLQRSPSDPPVPPAGEVVELIDRFYAAALERGITPVFITFWAPVWASRYRNCGLLDLSCRSMAQSSAKLVPDWPFMDEYEAYVRAVKQRWPRALIEPWNEPNLYWNHPSFKGTWAFAAGPGQMAAIQCAAYRGSKAAGDDPVLAPGWAWYRFEEYLAGVYAEGGGDCWDIANLHVYPGKRASLGEGSWMAAVFRAARALRSQYGDDAPIWVTEIGWTTSGADRVPATTQAEAARRAYNRLVTMPDVAGVMFHTLRDAPGPDYADPRHHEYGFGFLHQDWSPKPVYCHFAAQAGNQVAGC